MLSWSGADWIKDAMCVVEGFVLSWSWRIKFSSSLSIPLMCEEEEEEEGQLHQLPFICINWSDCNHLCISFMLQYIIKSK